MSSVRYKKGDVIRLKNMRKLGMEASWLTGSVFLVTRADEKRMDLKVLLLAGPGSDLNHPEGQFTDWSNPHGHFEYAIDYVVREILDEE